jgi:hypothetical protein
MQELDGQLLRHGAFYEPIVYPFRSVVDEGGQRHIENLFKEYSANSLYSKPPLELLPLELSCEPVPPERVVPVTVYHCDGSSGATTLGIEVKVGSPLKDIVAKAKQVVVGEKDGPLGGLASGNMDQTYPHRSYFELHNQKRLSDPWNVSQPLLLFIPAVPQACRTSLSAGSPHVVRLVVFMWRNRAANSEPEELPVPPIILNVDGKFAGGGKDALADTQVAILEAMRPFLRPGKEVSPSALNALVRCSRGRLYPDRQFSKRLVVSGTSTQQLAALWSTEADDLYDFQKYDTPDVHPSGAPTVLAASQARQIASEKREKAERAAKEDPKRIVCEIVDAQRCSKPERATGFRFTTLICQDYIPKLRTRLQLEPDAQDATRGTAVFQLWTWMHRSPEPKLDEPAFQPLIQANTDYLSGPPSYNSSNTGLPLPTTMRWVMKNVPGLAEAEEGIERWKRYTEVNNVTTVPALLKALETGEIKAAEQPHGLTVTLRPYQLQTLGFMQRAEREATSFRRKLWFPGPMREGVSCVKGQRGEQRPAWWWSPAFRYSSLSEPVCTSWGGFLGETMGLGKTVEVLALILSDRPDLPAVPKRLITLFPPDHPERQNQQPNASEAGNAQAERANGLVCSNATLVVCAVSLVGQWVAEATERAGGSLSIYQYHGQGRTRNVEELALKYDVVVTTYATLGSDWGRRCMVRMCHCRECMGTFVVECSCTRPVGSVIVYE